VAWIPAIPAGKTLLLKHLYNQERLRVALDTGHQTDH
jgi:hypothetical protein